MGLFDRFKKSSGKKATHGSMPTLKKTVDEPYLGNLNKTTRLTELLQTPQDQRGPDWQNEFLDNIGEASFTCGDPQVINGPDGFPYFQLFLPEPGKKFQCYVIKYMKTDFLLENGFGIVINPNGNNADWVLTHGDIVNYHLNGEFYTTKETLFNTVTEEEVIQEKEEVMIGQPSEELLPAYTRKVISGFLKHNGIASPKVLLMMRKKSDGSGVTQELVFNLTNKSFPDDSTYKMVMQAMRWYVPRHYAYAGVDESSFEQGFEPL